MALPSARARLVADALGGSVEDLFCEEEQGRVLAVEERTEAA